MKFLLSGRPDMWALHYSKEGRGKIILLLKINTRARCTSKFISVTILVIIGKNLRNDHIIT